ncbi:hypothetical protein MRB53_031349 [Persea americana]|uniref:Uncharacterized protein n=1 Tax=Persea americana TaxID=3435 RepID=A0ACC2KP95_PERAE|nr:hypothetical protein MRB53_031349 [Persea americana]
MKWGMNLNGFEGEEVQNAGIAPRREAALPVPLVTGKLLESSPRVAGVRVAVAVLVRRWSGSVSGTRTRGSRQVKKGCPFFSSPAYCCCVLTTVIREKSKKKQQREHHQSPSSQALIRGAFGFEKKVRSPLQYAFFSVNDDQYLTRPGCIFFSDGFQYKRNLSQPLFSLKPRIPETPRRAEIERKSPLLDLSILFETWVLLGFLFAGEMRKKSVEYGRKCVVGGANSVGWFGGD